MARSRRRSRRHRRRGSAAAQKIGGAALGVLAVGLAVAMVLFRPDAVERDPDTMCPDSGPSRVTALVVDTSDRIGPVSRADILGRLDDMIGESRPDELVLVYETAAGVRRPLIEVCNPGDPDTADPLFSNPELIRKRLEEGFRQPLDRLFRELVTRAPARRSPLMETIQAISVTVLARRPYAGIPKRLILVSDLLQHSDHLSVYDHSLEYGPFAESRAAAALSTNLEQVAVEILFVLRESHSQVAGTRQLVRFWERWLEAQGGRPERVSKVDGLN